MKSSPYHLVCGMEIHAELKTQSKMFCGCINDPFGATQPNTYTCPVCLGLPGALPVPNKTAIEWTIRLGLALNCQINLFSQFDRKHYFYPDLPKGYQISQYDLPFCYDGKIDTSLGPVRIRRIHLEEDTAKLQHSQVDGTKVSLIDFNRSSVPLIEIVTEPDIISPAHAKEYAKSIRQLLRYLDIADCDMEQGGMRLEANVSVADSDQLPDYKVELKNINSFRFLEQAISFEVQRQTLELEDSRIPKQETRGWNAQTNTTFPQRSKEDAEDYRYFPDPDIPPFRFTQQQITELGDQNPELPWQVAKRWRSTFQIEDKYLDVLLVSASQTEWLDAVFSELADQAQAFASALVNKKLPAEIWNQSPKKATDSYRALTQTETVDETQLASVIDQILVEFPEEVAAYQGGKTPLINFLLGQTVRKLGKKVDMTTLKSRLEERLTTS